MVSDGAMKHAANEVHIVYKSTCNEIKLLLEADFPEIRSNDNSVSKED